MKWSLPQDSHSQHYNSQGNTNLTEQPYFASSSRKTMVKTVYWPPLQIKYCLLFLKKNKCKMIILFLSVFFMCFKFLNSCFGHLPSYLSLAVLGDFLVYIWIFRFFFLITRFLKYHCYWKFLLMFHDVYICVFFLPFYVGNNWCKFHCPIKMDQKFHTFPIIYSQNKTSVLLSRISLHLCIT